MNKEELKKLIDEENMLEEEEMFKKFLVQNEENKKEFLTNETNKTEKSNDLLVGWGSWAGDSKPIKAKEFLQRKRYEDRQKKKVQITSEDVNKNPYVKVNNSFDKNFSNYLVKEIPYNVHSKEEFDRLNSTGVGKEWNTLSVYKKLIQPSVVKRIGQIIEPMQIADTTGAQKLCEIIEKVTKKKQRTKAKL